MLTGVFPDAAVTLTCIERGRYVVIYMGFGTLTLCEVEVFADGEWIHMNTSKYTSFIGVTVKQ